MTGGQPDRLKCSRRDQRGPRDGRGPVRGPLMPHLVAPSLLRITGPSVPVHGPPTSPGANRCPDHRGHTLEIRNGSGRNGRTSVSFRTAEVSRDARSLEGSASYPSRGWLMEHELWTQRSLPPPPETAL